MPYIGIIAISLSALQLVALYQWFTLPKIRVTAKLKWAAVWIVASVAQQVIIWNFEFFYYLLG